MTTRAGNTAALQHVLQNVVGAQPESPIGLALDKNGISGIADFLTLKLNVKEPLKYDVPATDDKPAQPNKPLLLADMYKLVSVQDFIIYHRTNVLKRPYHTLEDWETLSADNFDDFRINIAPTLSVSAAPSAFATAPPPTTLSHPDSLRDWNKGIKRDMTLFKEIKRDKDWDSWDAHFKATLTSQGLKRILDPNFTPIDRDDKILFDEQQKYVYAIFVRTLLTDKGKSIVRKHQDDNDAQSIYKEMVEYASHSTQAILDASDILDYITTVRIDDGTWNGTTASFVLHWQEQIRLYEKQVPARQHFHDDLKLSMLKYAVHPHPQLCSVQNVALQLAVKDGKTVNYTDYCNLLLSECAQVDRANFRRSGRRKKRAVYLTETTVDSGEEKALNSFDFLKENDHFDYNIDSDTAVLLANKLNRQFVNRVMMYKDQWMKLSPQGQATWDKLSESDKAIILKKPLPNPTSTPPRIQKTLKPRSSTDIKRHRTVQELLNAKAPLLDIDENADSTPSEDHGDDEDDLPDSEEEQAKTLHAFLASRGNRASPADIRNLLSTSSKRAATYESRIKETRKVNLHLIVPKEDKHESELLYLTPLIPKHPSFPSDNRDEDLTDNNTKEEPDKYPP